MGRQQRGKKGAPMDSLLKRLSTLLGIKNLVTVILTLVFAYLSVNNMISSNEFLTVFTVVIAFYFGTESDKQTKS